MVIINRQETLTSLGLLEKVVPGYLSWSKFVEFPDDGVFVLQGGINKQEKAPVCLNLPIVTQSNIVPEASSLSLIKGLKENLFITSLPDQRWRPLVWSTCFG